MKAFAQLRQLERFHKVLIQIMGHILNKLLVVSMRNRIGLLPLLQFVIHERDERGGQRITCRLMDGGVPVEIAQGMQNMFYCGAVLGKV